MNRAVVLAAIFATACVSHLQAEAPPSETEPAAAINAPPTPDAARAADLERRRQMQQGSGRRVPDPVFMPPEAETGDGNDVELPVELRERIFADALKRSGVPSETLRVVRSQSITWPDGSLGCPEPGNFYPQMLVPGYRLTLRAGERDYDYRATTKGDFRLCEARVAPHEDKRAPMKAPDDLSRERTDPSRQSPAQ